MRLTLLADGDADVLAEWGNIATLTHRVTRIIEGAYESEAVVDELRLALLFLPTLRALRGSKRYGRRAPTCRWQALPTTFAASGKLRGERWPWSANWRGSRE